MNRIPKDLYIATTESGATYVVNESGGLHYTSSDGWSQDYFRDWVSIDRPSLKDVETDNIHTFIQENGAHVERPVVGESIYGYNFSDWRISTPVVKVEDIEPQD